MYRFHCRLCETTWFMDTGKDVKRPEPMFCPGCGKPYDIRNDHSGMSWGPEVSIGRASKYKESDRAKLIVQSRSTEERYATK